MLNQLFTINLPEARSPQAGAIYHYADALLMCANPADEIAFASVARFACPAGAHRRGLAQIKRVQWLSLPLLLARWQQSSIMLFTATQRGAVLDLRGSRLIIELLSSDAILMLEACELALAGLAIDWQVQLLLGHCAAQNLMVKDAPSILKAFASLPLFGLSEALILDFSIHGTQDFTFAENDELLLPIRQISASEYATLLGQTCRITI